MGDIKGISMPPPFNPECSNKPYGLWKTEVSFWKELTSLVPKKRALAVALAIPEGSKLRNKIFSELNILSSIQTMRQNKSLYYE